MGWEQGEVFAIAMYVLFAGVKVSVFEACDPVLWPYDSPCLISMSGLVKRYFPPTFHSQTKVLQSLDCVPRTRQQCSIFLFSWPCSSSSNIFTNSNQEEKLPLPKNIPPSHLFHVHILLTLLVAPFSLLTSCSCLIFFPPIPQRCPHGANPWKCYALDERLPNTD